MNCPFHGVTIQEVDKHIDHRGWLVELFRDDDAQGLPKPAMAYISGTVPGSVRGPHEHRHQTDRFIFLGPSPMRLHLWDNRQGSENFGQYWEIELGRDRPASVVIPPGIVHAYQNVGKTESLVLNAPDRLYRGEKRAEQPDEVRYEIDPDSPFVIPDIDARPDQSNY